MAFQMDPEQLGLVDEVALVTGGARGIGKGCALQLARAGCHIAIADLDEETATATAREIEALGRQAEVVVANVRDEDQVNAMVEEVVARLGGLDVAVNNVGNPTGLQPFLDYTTELWHDIVDQNLTSSFLCSQAEARSMVERGIAGRIVTIASSSGIVGAPNIVAYGAAKAGVIHMTKTLAMELAPHGIRVNCIVPGTHLTERAAANTDPATVAFREAAAKAPPLARLGDPLETGGLAVFFASRLSAYVTGHSLLSDGGVTHTTARPAVPAR